jgi:uncharacterized protein
MTSPPPSSPCVKVCLLDADKKLCIGCGRTMAEIAAWGGMSELQRRDLMAQLPARIAAAQTNS